MAEHHGGMLMNVEQKLCVLKTYAGSAFAVFSCREHSWQAG